MHDFFSGIPTEMEKPVKNLAAAGTLTLEADNVKNTEEFNKLLQALPKLVDGNEKAGAWNDSYVKINANHAQGPFTLTTDLGGIGQVERVALGSVSNPGWGIGAPDSVSYSVSQDGQTWKELGTVTYAPVSYTHLLPAALRPGRGARKARLGERGAGAHHALRFVYEIFPPPELL